MSLTRIPSRTRSNSSPLIRLSSKKKFFDSKTSFLKSSCSSSESDGEYETSSEGRLHPGPEARSSLCRTIDVRRNSCPMMVSDDASSTPKVATELRIEVVGSTKNKNGAEIEEVVGETVSLATSKMELQFKVHPLQETDQLVSSFFKPVVFSEQDKSSECFPSDSLQTLQSRKSQSNLVLSTGKNSTSDIQSIYKKNKFQSDTYSNSIETNSVSKLEQNNFEFDENDQRVATEGNMDIIQNETSNLIGNNPELLPSSIYLKYEEPNVNSELKKHLMRNLQIMSQIENDFAPLRDKMNQIFNQVRDLKGMSFDFGPTYNNLLGISNSGCLSARENTTFQNNVVRSASFFPSLYHTSSVEYKLNPSTSYHTRKNHVYQTVQPSPKKLWFNEDMSSNPFRCTNHPETCNRRILPNQFENCPHAYFDKELVALESNRQESSVSNSLCNFDDHQIPYLADNSRHISLNHFPIVQQHLHSFHANVLPGHSENLHRRCRSKVPTLETSKFRVHTESKIVPIRNGNNLGIIKKQYCSRHHPVTKKGLRETDPNLKSSLKNIIKSEKPEKIRKSSTVTPSNEKRHKNSTRSRRRRCKQHCNHLHHQITPSDNSMHKCRPPEMMEASKHFENPSSKNGDTISKTCETLSCPGGSPQLIKELTLITKEIVAVEEPSNQVEENLQSTQVPSTCSGNTVMTKITCSPKNSVLLKSISDDKGLQLKASAKPSIEQILATESLFQRKRSDLVQKQSSSIFSYSSHISRPQKCERVIPVLDHKYLDKACNTENISEGEYRKDSLNVEASNLEMSALGASKEIMEKSLTILKSEVSEKGSRKSISNQHSKMSLPKTHERITVVPIIFSSGMSEPLNRNLDFTGSQKSGNAYKKTAPLNAESEGGSSESNFSLSTRAESFATEISHLAQKCAFIMDSRGRISSGTTLNSESSFYSFKKSLGSPTRIEGSKKNRNESKTKEISSKSLISYQTSINPVRNSVAVRRIRGIRTSPEDFIYE